MTTSSMPSSISVRMVVNGELSLRPLAYHLCPYQPLGHKRRSGTDVPCLAEQIAVNPITVVSLDSTSVKVHPDAAGSLKNGEQAVGKSRGGLNTKIHIMVVDNRCAIGFILSGGAASDTL
jgi:hypothetical protein